MYLGLPRIVAQGVPHLRHQARQVRFRHEGIRPQPIPDLRLGHGFRPLLEQQVQQLEGLRLEVQLLPSPEELSGFTVERELSECDPHRGGEKLRTSP
jgi:hypothetical protein